MLAVAEQRIELGVAHKFVPLMRSKVKPKLDAEGLGERKTYRRARRRALARLREGMDLRWTPPRARQELHGRSAFLAERKW